MSSSRSARILVRLRVGVAGDDLMVVVRRLYMRARGVRLVEFRPD